MNSDEITEALIPLFTLRQKEGIEALTEASDFIIERIQAREVLDSRGNPTVQADVHTKRGFGRFSVPSGASKGRFEAHELRDTSDKRNEGLGERTPVGNVTKIIGPSELDFDPRNHPGLNGTMLSLAGQGRRDRLGAN